MFKVDSTRPQQQDVVNLHFFSTSPPLPTMQGLPHSYLDQLTKHLRFLAAKKTNSFSLLRLNRQRVNFTMVKSHQITQIQVLIQVLIPICQPKKSRFCSIFHDKKQPLVPDQKTARDH
jgi:hypothetical protein